jgi:lysophospholipase L1-like esterase
MLRRYDSGDPTPTRAYGETFRRLLDRVVAVHSPRLILMEPFFLPLNEEQQEWLPELDAKREVVRQLATDYDATLVPLHTIFTRAVAERDAAELAADGVHPTPVGSELIADAWRAGAVSRGVSTGAASA